MRVVQQQGHIHAARCARQCRRQADDGTVRGAAATEFQVAGTLEAGSAHVHHPATAFPPRDDQPRGEGRAISRHASRMQNDGQGRGVLALRIAQPDEAAIRAVGQVVGRHQTAGQQQTDDQRQPQSAVASHRLAELIHRYAGWPPRPGGRRYARRDSAPLRNRHGVPGGRSG